MRIALVGPELEENLGLRYLHAGLLEAGHEPVIFEFHEPAQIWDVASAIAAFDPALVGLSMVFTGRGREYLELARVLREKGYAGHVTAGGHFAAFNAGSILSLHRGIDSVVHGDGEHAMVALAARLDDPGSVPGVAYRDSDGRVVEASPWRNVDDLDTLPWPTRPARFQDYMGLPIANFIGSRGCYGSCTYCSIHAWYRQAGGETLRQRSIERVADEMSHLFHDRGVRIFNFHDDNFFLRDESANLARFTGLRDALAARRVGRIALQVKARPDSIVPAVVDVLREIGLFRVFLGVESNSSPGLAALGRNIRADVNHRAISLLRSLGVHVTYNLLMFNPGATIATLRDEISFMRGYADLPCNFGRVEVYSGTALESTLRRAGRLQGDWLGYAYEIEDARAQRVFEMYRRVFLDRNFREQGTTVQAMRVAYDLHLLRQFAPRWASARLERHALSLIRELNESSASILSAMCDFVEKADVPPSDECQSFASDLAIRRQAFDSVMLRRMAAAVAEMEARGQGGAGIRGARSTVGRAASAAAIALMVSVTGCRGGKQAAPQAEQMASLPSPVVVEYAAADASREADAGTADAGTGDAQAAAEPQAALAPLPDDKVEAVEKRIAKAYKKDYSKLAKRHSLLGKEIEIEMAIGPAGAVTSAKVVTADLAPAASAEIVALASGWTFPDLGMEGTCVVTLKAARKPTGPDHNWHICEMMMEPMQQ